MALTLRMGNMDPTSYSEPDKCTTVFLDWDVKIDFATQTFSGTAHLTFEKLVDKLDTLLLDCRELSVESVSLKETGEKLSFNVDQPVKVPFGSRLSVTLPAHTEKRFTLSFNYTTSSKASALQWLKPEQTAGKRQPYLFSQSQAIHARSLFPCQDTPAVKWQYKAKVRAPKEVTVLMSAKRLGTTPVEGDSEDVYSLFEMKVPIPSYLLAIVAGDLESRDLGPRSKVWAEKEYVDESAYEFAETETMLQTAEALMGPYVWGHYDLLVLPPSFPYGGMENPCLTFVTPTLLAGDRSLADVIAHEISHSWTGNLVTNKTFEHFWLNEGHTMFVERKILGRLHGEPHKQVHSYEGWGVLAKTVDQLNKANEEPYTRLVPNLEGVDPDDSFSSIPYEKGFALLTYLESLLGGPEVYEKFLRVFINRFEYKSITTEDWKALLYEHFSSPEDQAKLNSVDWDTWLNGLGMPPYEPSFDLSLMDPCRNLQQRWQQAADDSTEGFSASDLEDMPSLLVKEFVSILGQASPPLSAAKVRNLERVYHFFGTRNAEIRLKWLELCIKARVDEAFPHALDFMNSQGRMKFVRPIYRALYGWEEKRQQAIDNFKAHLSEMHSTTAMLVAKDLNVTE